MKGKESQEPRAPFPLFESLVVADADAENLVPSHHYADVFTQTHRFLASRGWWYSFGDCDSRCCGNCNSRCYGNCDSVSRCWCRHVDEETLPRRHAVRYLDLKGLSTRSAC